MELILFNILRLTFHGILVVIFGMSSADFASGAILENTTDIYALLDFKSHINDDPLGVLNSWNNSIHFCQWKGVECDAKHKVIFLELKGQGLAGNISPHVGNLSFLRVLTLLIILSKVEFLKRLASWPGFKHLTLSNNHIAGEVPATLSRCTYLYNLALDHNDLDGRIPPVLGSLSNPVTLSLRNNSLTGTIPASIGNLTCLEELYISDNYLEAKLPDSMARLRNLTALELSVNSLSGDFPAVLYNLSSLVLLGLSFNNFSGTLRSSIGFNLPTLQLLDLASNSFTGPIPVSLSNISGLQHLDIQINEFTGNISNSFGNLKKLWWFNVAENHLGSNGDNDLTFLSSLTNCTKLEFLSFYENQLRGTFPSILANMSTTLIQLLAGGNGIRGSIPEEITKLINLNVLSMEETFLKGDIPASIGKLSSLRMIHLESNRFTGKIPNSIGDITKLVNLYVSYNSLEGNIPSSLGNCTHLQSLDLSYNKLNGTIPNTLSRISSLSVPCDLSYNSFSGLLPEEVGELTHFVALDVSSNKLSGNIPRNIGSCVTLEQLNMQSNSFQGAVPLKGVFRNLSGIHVLGNSNLCGGIPGLHLLPCFETSHRKQTGFLVVIILCADGFSSSNWIGSGSFGTVYEGHLSANSTIVAVNVLKLQQRGTSKSFIAECKTLRNIRHRSLVRVLSACSSIDFEGNEFKAIVYEFMPNGSLDECLHPEAGQLRQKSLNFLQRINIAIDVASALHYLHHQCQTPVVHCDLKPSNVLLGTDLIAHVSDFGLARLLSNLNQDDDLNQFSSLGRIKGTIGYAAPEYGMGVQVTTQGGVYGFGILLLELFTGRGPTDEQFSDGLDLHNFVKMALPDQVMVILDQSAFYNEEEGNTMENDDFWSKWTFERREHLISVLQIGVACSEASLRIRMNIRQAAKNLQSIKDKFEFVNSRMRKRVANNQS